MRHTFGLLLVLLVAGCGGATGPGSGGGAGPAPAGYAVVVSRGGQELARLDLAALLALPQTSVETPGTGGDGAQEGPAVAAVLAEAGVDGPVDVTVTGDEGTVAYTAAELAGAVLDVTNRGTTKLAGADLPQDRWLRNVTSLAVP